MLTLKVLPNKNNESVAVNVKPVTRIHVRYVLKLLRTRGFFLFSMQA